MSSHNYGTRSLERLATAANDLQILMKRVGTNFPNAILEGKRTEEQQVKNIQKKVSKTMDSRHLDEPANAVDAAPDPLAWPQEKKLQQRIATVVGTLPPEKQDEIMGLIERHVKDVSRWYYFGGYTLGVASEMLKNGEMQQSVRWGGDWDGDRQLLDQTFDDLPHFELR
jgi:hypothetical protein